MSYTLRDKILEFRLLQNRNELAHILENERRAEFERTQKNNALQQYRNDKQLEGYTKYSLLNLHNSRFLECEQFNQIKNGVANKRINEEKKYAEEKLADALQKARDDKEIEFKKRLILRNAEPELRELADKIEKKITGGILFTQIEDRKKRHSMELARERQLEHNMVQADLEAEARDQARIKAKNADIREAMQKAISEERSKTREKDKREAWEKEENKRIIDELVAEENEKIAKEQEEQRRKREQTAAEYREFIKSHEELKRQQAMDEQAFEQKVLAERNRQNEWQRAVEQKKKDALNARIEAQEKMGEYTIALQEAHERERKAYLEASEALARAKMGLAELEYSEDKERKKNQMASEMKKEIEFLKAFKEKQRQEEQEYERELDRYNLELMRKEAAEREAAAQAKREKFTKDMKDQLELRKRLLEEEYERLRSEDAAERERIKSHQERIEREREAMLAEYEKYLNYWTHCKDVDKSNEAIRFPIAREDCD